MKMRTGIRVKPQKFRIMVGLYIDEVRIGKPAGKVPPIPKVRGHHDFFLSALPVVTYRKPKSRADPVVRQSKRMNEEVTDQKGTIAKRAKFEMQKW